MLTPNYFSSAGSVRRPRARQSMKGTRLVARGKEGKKARRPVGKWKEGKVGTASRPKGKEEGSNTPVGQRPGEFKKSNPLFFI